MKSRITYSVSGEFGIEGIDLTKLPAKLYSAVAKLKDYENTGLSPDEVDRLKYDGYRKTRNVDKVRTMDIEELAFVLMCPYQFEEGAKIPESCAQMGGKDCERSQCEEKRSNTLAQSSAGCERNVSRQTLTTRGIKGCSECVKEWLERESNSKVSRW